MHTHRPAVNLRPDSAPKPARVTEAEIGFHDAVTSIAAWRSQAAGDGCLETKEDAEEYRRAGRQESPKSPADVVVGLPKVGIFVASGSTSQELAAKAA